MGSQSRASTPPSDPQRSCYTIIITRLLLTARGCRGLGWLLEKSGQRLAGSHPGSFLGGRETGEGQPCRGAGASLHRGNLHAPLAPSDRHRPQAVEVWLYSPRVPSQQVTLGSCAFGAAGTGGGCAPCGWRAGTGRVGGRCPLHPRAGAAVWPRGRRISVCTCVHVRASVRTPGCACMCVYVCLCACVCTCVPAGSRRRSRGQKCGAPGRVGTVWEERPPGFAQANQPQALPPDSWGRRRGKSTDLAARGASVVQAARVRRWFSGRAAPHLILGSARPGGCGQTSRDNH